MGGGGGGGGAVRMLDGGHIVFSTNPISIGIMQVISLYWTGGFSSNLH